MVDLGLDLDSNKPPQRPATKKPVPMVSSPREFPEEPKKYRPGACSALYVSAILIWFLPFGLLLALGPSSDIEQAMCASIGVAIAICSPYTAIAMSLAYMLDWMAQQSVRN